MLTIKEVSENTGFPRIRCDIMKDRSDPTGSAYTGGIRDYQEKDLAG